MNRILVIDDDVNVCRMLKRILMLEGEYEIDMAHDGKTGLQKFEQFTPQIVLLDVMMPGTGGIQTLMEIKRRDSEVGVIMITASEDEALAKKALSLGAYEYLVKPFNAEYLKTVVMVKVMDYLD